MNAMMDSTLGAGEMLVVLVERANSSADATALLHEDVILHRLDGSMISGRATVVDAICNRGSEAQFTIMGRYGEGVHVGIVIEGLPGHLLFMMTATVRDGRLSEIWMD